jgi:hypothetical protein
LKIKTISAKFVDHLPDHLAEGVLYISEEFAIAGHKCCCGCGEEVITPLNPAQWRLTKARNTVSLYPSIGNWKYQCRSHYWIKNNQVIDAGPMKAATIEMVKQKDRRDKNRYIASINESSVGSQVPSSQASAQGTNPPRSWIDAIFGWLVKLFGK